MTKAWSVGRLQPLVGSGELLLRCLAFSLLLTTIAIAQRQPSESETIMEPSHHLVLYDGDTGVDDAVAIMLALRLPRVAIVGVSTVSGNTDASQAAKNTRFLLDQFATRDQISVHVGSKAPLSTHSPKDASNVHGQDGLGGVSKSYWRDRAVPKLPDDAVEFLANQAEQSKSQLTIVATGPLTNIARALERDDNFVHNVKQIYVMGGAVDCDGNVTRSAEFNFHYDPVAAAKVIDSGIPLTLFPLDVTERVKLMAAEIDQQSRWSRPMKQLLRDITKQYFEFHSKKYDFTGSYVHDALPVACLQDASLFKITPVNVVVDTGPPNAGRIRRAGEGERGAEIGIALQVDAKRVLGLLMERLAIDSPQCTYKPAK